MSGSKKEVAYIAGKISGDAKYRSKFAAAAKALEERDRVVLSPAVLPDGLTQADYMRICLAMIEAADVVVFLPDYRESKGAMVERAFCQKVQKPIKEFLEAMNE